MTRRDSWDTLIGIALGAIGAVALAKLLTEKKCKACGGTNSNSQEFCIFCGGKL